MTVHRRETVEIIGDLVAQLGATFLINSATLISGPGVEPKVFLLTTNNTYHLRPKNEVTINSIVYKIQSIVIDTSITVTGASLPSVSSFSIPAPKYYYGTVIDTTNVLTGVVKANLITPMVYCYEPIKDRFFTGDTPIDRESELKLFFLEQGDFETWKTDDFLNMAIKQMRSLAYRFIDEVCQDSKIVNKPEDFDLINRAKMKLKNTDKAGSNLFNHTLSGVEMSVILSILRGQC